MKTSVSLVFLFSLTIILFACNKEGPAGPAGATGATGPQGNTGSQGTPGNANVVQYNYGNTYDFTTNSDFNLNVTTTAGTMNRSAWFVYLKYSGLNEYTYALPGYGYNGDSYYRSSYYFNTGLNKVTHTITRLNGPGEIYSGAKIIRIYANTNQTGGRMNLPDIDFSNYTAVREYFNLPVE